MADEYNKPEIKSFYVMLNRENLVQEDYVAGIFQGLLYGICSIPCGTTLWDCEKLEDMFVFQADCTEVQIRIFSAVADIRYQGLYKIKQLKS